MAPEVFDNKGYTLKADVFSYGVTLQKHLRSFIISIVLDCPLGNMYPADTLQGLELTGGNHETCHNRKRTSRPHINQQQLPT